MLSKEAFVSLVDSYSRTLHRVARAILRHEEDAKDALQESVLKAWANRHKLRDPALFATWMTRILINECHTMRRRQQRALPSAQVQGGLHPPEPNPDLHRAIYDLREKYRLPLVLHYIEGYSLLEIATMLRLPITTIRSRLYTARQQLRLELSEEKEVRPHEA